MRDRAADSPSAVPIATKRRLSYPYTSINEHSPLSQIIEGNSPRSSPTIETGGQKAFRTRSTHGRMEVRVVVVGREERETGQKRAQTARRHDGNDNTGAKSRFRSPGESIKVETERRKEPESPTATCTRNSKALGRFLAMSQTLSTSKRYIKG